MFERGVSHGYDQLVRRLAVSFDNDGPVLTFGGVEQGAKSVKRDFLVAKINRRNRATGDADNLLILLCAKQEWRRRGRDRDSRLQDEIRTKEQKKDQKENDVDERKHHKPAEIVFLRAAQFHQ